MLNAMAAVRKGSQVLV